MSKSKARASRTEGGQPLARSISRRDFLKAASLTAGGLALAACTPAAQSTPAPTTAPTVIKSKPFEGVTLRFLGDEGVLDFLQTNPAKYQDFLSASGMTVEQVATPYDSLLEKIMIDLNSGTGQYDVLAFDPGWTGQVYETGGILPLDDFVNELKADPDHDFDDILASSFLSQKWDGHWVGLPYNIHSNGWLVYRTDVFEAAQLQPPETFDDFVTVAAALQGSKAPDGKEIRFGTAGAGQRDDYILMEWTQRVLSAGTTNDGMGNNYLWDEAWQPTFNNEVGQYVAEYYRDLLNTYGPPGPAAMTWAEVRPLMFGGDVAMIGMAWDTWVTRFLDPAQTPYAGKFGWAPAPHRVNNTRGGIQGGGGLKVNAASKNKAAAFELIKYLTSKEHDLDRAQNFSASAIRSSTQQDPLVKTKWPMLEARTEVYENLSPEPLIPEYPKVKEFLGQALSEILTGAKSSKDALDAAALQTVALFKETGRI